jgi:hypothetical protein
LMETLSSQTSCHRDGFHGEIWIEDIFVVAPMS